MESLDRINSKLFATVNGLVPIQELRSLRNYFNKLNYWEAAGYIESSGMELIHFYFKRDDPLACFCYYRDLVFIDIPIFTREALESFQILDLIKFEEGRMENCLSRGDFKTLFYIVDKRIALLAYEKLFNHIPDQDKYETFWFVYSRCGLGLDDFPEEYIRKIMAYRNGPLDLPGDDEYVTIYRGQGEAASPPAQIEHSWTLDINTAIRYAVQSTGEGQVYKALIRKRDAAAYIKRKNEKEIVVFPSLLKDVVPVTLLSLADLKPDLRLDIMDRYDYYEKQLKTEYFYRPEGIHGIMHTRRVLLLNLIISCLQGYQERFINILCTAALYHDIGRINDNFDPQHGIESYRKARQLGLINLEQPDHAILKYIIENHCISDKLAREHLDKYNLNDRGESKFLFDTFKDADGLDRVRINDLDIRQLRTDYGRKLLLVARQLHNDFDLFFRQKE
ncbi:hypothetical protein ASZ90_019139 [hydrocarbon metagenome]|uniref:HD domain-containing protein n=1 Tax=hydrocarbon metagenome TaxID=938273 RepID=A0A0W8E470_9ZZZZ